MKESFDPKDGHEYLLAWWVKGPGIQERWQIELLTYISYDDGDELAYANGDSFSDWDIRDADFYIESPR